MGFFDIFSWLLGAKRKPAAEVTDPPVISGGADVDAKAVATPKKEPAAEPASLWDAPPVPEEFHAADDDLDAAFGAAFGGGETSSGSDTGDSRHATDEAATKELFAGIAANYSRPVKNFIHELKRGTATKEWVEICRPVMSSIIDAAESMELSDVAKCMADFDEALSMAQSEEGAELHGEGRELLLSIYDELVEILPEAFLLGEENDRRETIIIHSLLRQIPDVGYVTIEKMYGAGLTSMSTLFLATKDDMAVTTGIPKMLCDRICQKMQSHKARLEGSSPDDLKEGHLERLIELVAELRKHHEQFKVACEDDRHDATLAAVKRESRCTRQACALKINVLLAEMGELDLVEQIQKLAFERRIEKLDAYIGRTIEILPAAIAADSTTVGSQAPVEG